jgi:hypothetical protein
MHGGVGLQELLLAAWSLHRGGALAICVISRSRRGSRSVPATFATNFHSYRLLRANAVTAFCVARTRPFQPSATAAWTKEGAGECFLGHHAGPALPGRSARADAGQHVGSRESQINGGI